VERRPVALGWGRVPHKILKVGLSGFIAPRGRGISLDSFGIGRLRLGGGPCACWSCYFPGEGEMDGVLVEPPRRIMRRKDRKTLFSWVRWLSASNKICTTLKGVISCICSYRSTASCFLLLLCIVILDKFMMDRARLKQHFIKLILLIRDGVGFLAYINN
jgi:hypothetical protein